MSQEEWDVLHWSKKAMLCGFSKEELDAIYKDEYNPYEW